MGKFNWINVRIGEQEELTDHMMKELNVTRALPDEFVYEGTLESQYLDWTYGINSQRFDRFFDKLIDERCDRLGIFYGRNE